MRPRFIVYVLFASLFLAAGYWMGRLSSRSSNPPPDTASGQPGAGNSGGSAPLPVVEKRPPAPANPNPEGMGGKLSLEEIIAKIQNLKQRNPHWEECEKLLDSVAAADIPRVMAAIDKNPSNEVRSSLRESLLRRWAKENPSAAMACANGVVGAAAHEQAILAVLSGWAE
jgi:hypothetical protein